MEIISCWIDQQNIIWKVSNTWDSNMDPQSWSERASSSNIIGKSLFEFICDDMTRMYLKSILDLVRLVPQSAFRYYRCDTPTTKRYMKMIVSWEPDGIIRFSHELIRSEPLMKKVVFTTVRTSQRSENNDSQDNNSKQPDFHYVRCSLCNQISKNGLCDWEDADKIRPSLLISSDVIVTYGICQNCLQGGMQQPTTSHKNEVFK